MDGGSSINILYYETFRRMGLIDKNLSQSNTVFHGVVPGKSAYPVGKIELGVAFGDEFNYRVEKLTFEVVKIRSPYHAIFGRPTYAKFMARPCYVYLQLKMPGHNGTITVHLSSLALVPIWIQNRKARSSSSSVRTGTSLHGSLQTCRVY